MRILSIKFTIGKLVLGMVMASLVVEASPAQTKPLELGYPELQVTPLASKRVADEARLEQASSWLRHAPVQASALATMAAAGALMSEDQSNLGEDQKTNIKYAAGTGFIVGGSWLALTAYLDRNYRPYAEAQSELAGLPASSRVDQLTRERYAEEALIRAASFGRRLKWISVGSNLATSAFILSAANSDGAKAVGAISALLSFTPVVFPYRWQFVAHQHNLYKKRIYGPIVSSGLLKGSSGEVVPSLVAALEW